MPCPGVGEQGHARSNSLTHPVTTKSQLLMSQSQYRTEAFFLGKIVYFFQLITLYDSEIASSLPRKTGKKERYKYASVTSLQPSVTTTIRNQSLFSHYCWSYGHTYVYTQLIVNCHNDNKVTTCKFSSIGFFLHIILRYCPSYIAKISKNEKLLTYSYHLKKYLVYHKLEIIIVIVMTI